MAVEVHGAFGALVDDRRVVVSCSNPVGLHSRSAYRSKSGPTRGLERKPVRPEGERRVHAQPKPLPTERRLFPDAEQERARSRGGVQARRRAQPRRRGRRGAGRAHWRGQPAEPEGRDASEICDELVAAAKHIPKERLGSTDDCGFSPFSIDEKPLHGSPDFARVVAFEKIASRVQGTKMAAEKLGIPVPAVA